MRSSRPLVAIGLLVACRELPDSDTDDGTDTWPDTDDTGTAIDDIDPSLLPAGPTPCREPMLADVTTVTDGDTFHVVPASGGGEEIIRVIGVDTPEIDHGSGAECWGDEAWAYTRSRVDGARVWLTFDSDCTDAYDRTLAYVHLGLAPAEGFDANFLDYDLLRTGNAETLSISPNDTFEDVFTEAAGQARVDDLGLWSTCQ